MTVAFVTAIFNIHPTRSTEIWDRLSILSQTIPIHIVCSPEDADKVPKSATPYFLPFQELTTYKLIAPLPDLPPIRNVDKDTKEYMIVMNAKTEILQYVKTRVYADHYVWIDAGISKIFKDPHAIFRSILAQTVSMKSDTILMPGCWPRKESNPAILTEKINWRFCGGFFVVPRAYVADFAIRMFDGVAALGAATGRATWEVNTWCFIERHLPIQWEKGDHNESILDCLAHYQAT